MRKVKVLVLFSFIMYILSIKVKGQSNDSLNNTHHLVLSFHSLMNQDRVSYGGGGSYMHYILNKNGWQVNLKHGIDFRTLINSSTLYYNVDNFNCSTCDLEWYEIRHLSVTGFYNEIEILYPIKNNYFSFKFGGVLNLLTYEKRSNISVGYNDFSLFNNKYSQLYNLNIGLGYLKSFSKLGIGVQYKYWLLPLKMSVNLFYHEISIYTHL